MDAARLPWSRIFLAAALIGPPLWIGGVPPEVVPTFVLVVALACNRLCARSSEPLRVPWIAVLGVFATIVTLVQWLPLGLRGLIATGLDAEVSAALVETGSRAWPGLSVTPGDAALESARLAGLTALCIAAAQLSWRTTTVLVAIAGTVVALVGFAHEIAGVDLIYGTYQPRETLVSPRMSALSGSFVNPNHQSGLLLLGLFAAGGLAADQHRLGLDARDPAKVDRHADRWLAAVAALTIQLPALLLSLSRGALAALLLVAPFALWLALRVRRRSRPRPARGRRSSHLRWVVLAGMGAVLLLVARHGAWRELATLADLVDPDAELYVKLRMLEDAPALIGLSPVLGIGPGAFVDLYPTVDSQPSPVLFTHLESAPLASVLRWGPVAGSIIVLGLIGWWVSAMYYGGRPREAVARRVVLLGVLALGLQSLADFSLEFLGVAAPAAALVGALSPPRWLRWPTRPARKVLLASMATATIVAVSWLPSTWAHRERRNEAMARGELDPGDLVRMRPLDGRLHGLLARRAAGDRQWVQARARAKVATHLRPGSIDAWLLRAAAEAETGALDDAMRSTRRALSLLRARPDETLLRYILQRYPDPETLIVIAPDETLAWQHLAEGLIAISPEHADALAAARQEARPDDPAPLRIRGRLARSTRNPALALHHARLLRQIAPEEVSSHLAVVAALRSFSPPRHDEARDALEQALEETAIADPQEQSSLREELLRTLLALGDRKALERARQVSDVLMRQPAGRAARLRWEALAAELAEAERRLSAAED